ncbi:phosphonatase-like hydrolase [Dermatobacter hominis]|uniref:phosphonatase-like hydrolase n=1 Tax=Dermatobacter hominis TaxID=2884263 RepID=UPI001D0F5099|nr:phosphonatase-like hydrolase [Dermatobacter hominis]UDY36882.1 phosphonatase-like hydrolase [Dermatobacter hominis]
MRTEIVVMDMAGTTVADDGLVVAAFTEAVRTLGITPDHERFPAMMDHVLATMGESKLTVFRALFEGDEELARSANAAFEDAYADLVDDGRCEALPGAAETITALQERGLRVALTTGFAPRTRDAILAALGWDGLVELALSPADVGGRGRPYPDLNLTALLRLGATDVRAVATVGDTAFDVLAGLSAGAGVVAGVLSGAHDRPTLQAAGAHHVIDAVSDLPPLLHLD